MPTTQPLSDLDILLDKIDTMRIGRQTVIDEITFLPLDRMKDPPPGGRMVRADFEQVQIDADEMHDILAQVLVVLRAAKAAEQSTAVADAFRSGAHWALRYRREHGHEPDADTIHDQPIERGL